MYLKLFFPRQIMSAQGNARYATEGAMRNFAQWAKVPHIYIHIYICIYIYTYIYTYIYIYIYIYI